MPFGSLREPYHLPATKMFPKDLN